MGAVVMMVAVGLGLGTAFGSLLGLGLKGAPFVWRRDGEANAAAPVAFYFSADNYTQGDMSVISGMSVEALGKGKHGYDALFRNDKANFSAKGMITGLEQSHAHGILHGKFSVPSGDHDGMLEGKWMHVNPDQAGQEDVDAFSAILRAHQELTAQQEKLLDILALVAAEED